MDETRPLPPSSPATKPKPLSGLNHLTTPSSGVRWTDRPCGAAGGVSRPRSRRHHRRRRSRRGRRSRRPAARRPRTELLGLRRALVNLEHLDDLLALRALGDLHLQRRAGRHAVAADRLELADVQEGVAGPVREGGEAEALLRLNQETVASTVGPDGAGLSNGEGPPNDRAGRSRGISNDGITSSSNPPRRRDGRKSLPLPILSSRLRQIKAPTGHRGALCPTRSVSGTPLRRSFVEKFPSRSS